MYMCGIDLYDFFTGSGGFLIHVAKLRFLRRETKNIWLNVCYKQRDSLQNASLNWLEVIVTSMPLAKIAYKLRSPQYPCHRDTQ